LNQILIKDTAWILFGIILESTFIELVA